MGETPPLARLITIDLDPVEVAALGQRIRVDAQTEPVLAGIWAKIAQAIGQAKTTSDGRPRCINGTCRRFPESVGLCNRCRQCQDRLIAQGLVTRAALEAKGLRLPPTMGPNKPTKEHVP